MAAINPTGCITRCNPVDQMDWQKQMGIIRMVGDGICPPSQVIAGLGSAVFTISKHCFLIGFIYTPSPVVAGSQSAVSPANGTSITANFDLSTGNSLSVTEQAYIKMMTGAAEEIKENFLINKAFCTSNFNVLQRNILVSNLTVGAKTVQPIVIDFEQWFVTSV